MKVTIEEDGATIIIETSDNAMMMPTTEELVGLFLRAAKALEYNLDAYLNTE